MIQQFGLPIDPEDWFDVKENNCNNVARDQVTGPRTRDTTREHGNLSKL